ncbi:MAG: MaoC family dehydratase [Clostridiales Family XIII bacterium]|jgi:acyl dehydratase|nr:MaoC family dehydratase [Clostridiales Family XIII bacterium]
MPTNTIGFFLEDYQAGEVMRHAPTKTIFESDNNLFSLLTMNHHPVHTNEAYAQAAQHGQILVVGTLVFSIVVGMTVNDISGKAIANLDYERIEHLGPVFVGDTLRAESTVLDVRPSASKPDRGVLYVETTAYKQGDQPVLRFRRHVLLPKKEAQ